MNMVKSVLLGSAAGLVAVTAGQAADLPVKAQPVQYVKVCNLYGAGFYYMPGTDMCLKIGGWARAEARWGVNGNSTTGDYTQLYNGRYTNNMWTRERGYITADVREQTAYGVARGYLAVGISSQNSGGEANSGQFSANRTFVQWAGFTAGLSVSFYDFYPAAALMINAAQTFSEDTGDGGWWVWGYTANFGGGFSATIAAEERRESQILGFGGASGSAALSSSGAVILTPAATNLLGGVTTPGANGVLPNGTFAAGNGYGGWQSPDIVANLRVDQAWGSGQLMGALHEVNAGLYGATPSTGHPTDTWGWVVGAGLRLNAPFLGAGDYIIGEVNYTQGATRYLSHGGANGNQTIANGNTEGFGIGSDCVYGGTVAAGNNTGCNLTTAWSFNVGYEHYWTPNWHQSFVGGYLAESYNAAANNMLCSGENAFSSGAAPALSTTYGSGAGTAALAAAGCNNNWNIWEVGSRLQYDVTKSFYLSVDLLYQKLDSAQLPGAAINAGSGVSLSNSSVNTVANETNWMVGLRMHKDFLP
jgi:Porin subfamily